MGLSQARTQFFEIRQKCQVIVRNHAFRGHPERGFSKQELIRLVKTGKGRFTENDSKQAIENSYLFFPTDEEVEIEGEGSSQKETVIVCSAYREV